MSISDDAQQSVEAYLGRLRRGLHGLGSEEAREIVEELRSHIMEKAGAGGEVTMGTVREALMRLGTPEELAAQYVADHVLARAEVSRSPFRVLDSLFRWASLSVAGFLVLLGSLIGYVVGAMCLLVALVKPFHPHTAGLWSGRDSAGDLAIFIRLGFGNEPATGHDVLGWWIVPVGLIVGCGLVVLTTRFALWCVRQYRKSIPLPRG